MEKFLTVLEDNTVLALQQEITLYREHDIEGIALDSNLKTKEPLVAEVLRLRKAEGYVLKVTEDDLKTPLFEGSKVVAGDVVIFSEKEVDAFREEHKAEHEAKLAEEEKAKLIASLEDLKVELTGEESIEDLEGLYKEAVAKKEKADKAAKKNAPKKEEKTDEERGEDGEEKELVYLNKTVVSVANRVVNGKLYKDVHVASGETFTLTKDDFDKDVNPRDGA